ncbi:hypoxanthine phosphoribosyltransferase [bacterium]|nr:hypoxanthine phosphoribosyltransferase [bacterium]
MTPAEYALLISEPRIAGRVRDLAGEIIRNRGDGELCLIGLMKGSFMFMADLSRELSRRGVPLLTDVMTVSSYREDVRSSGRVSIIQDITLDIKGRDVLLIDDILDSGLTLETVRGHLHVKGAAKISVCVLLAKERPGRAGPLPEYTGFSIGTEFVVGYGLDMAGKYRELPAIYALDGGSPG